MSVATPAPLIESASQGNTTKDGPNEDEASEADVLQEAYAYEGFVWPIALLREMTA